MQIIALSIFPDIFESFLSTSLIKKSLEDQYFSFESLNIREFSTDKHKQVDDTPYGGGA